MEQEQSFTAYYAATKDNEFQSLYSFAVDALTFSNKINIYHWQCEKGFIHTHLQEVYEIIRDFADELVEITLGTGTEFKIDEKTYKFSDEIYNEENMQRKLRDFIDAVENLAKQFQNKIALNNLMTDTVQKLEKEYGLLTNFS
jgi:DNA-binding ferritin-like protein